VSATLTIGGVSATFTVTTGTKDTAPDSFTFTDVTGAALNVAVESNSITVSGITAAAPISVVGGSYKIDSGSYRTTAGTVTNGSSVTVKVTASAAFGTKKTATLNIGGVTGAFNVTTVAKDTTPDSVSFTPKTGVTPNTLITSETTTVTGINAPAPITVSGGKYSVNGGAWTTLAGTIANNGTLRLQVLSSTSYDAAATVTVTVGGVSATFTATTLVPNSSLPEVAVDQPTDTDGTTPLVFTTGGTGTAAGWAGEDYIAYIIGGSAAQSGVTANGSSSWLETTVTGTCTVSFFQKVSSQATYDTLKFSVGGVVKSTVSGNVNWQQKNFVINGAGPHVLRWTYTKNASGKAGMDAAWVDRVKVSPFTKVTVLSPNGGEVISRATTTTIAWSAPAQAEKFNVYYTLNNGTTWTMLATGISGSSYPWDLSTVPKTSTLCKVKVAGFTTLNAAVGADVSDKVFTIQ
jgi:hypothetical protein